MYLTKMELHSVKSCNTCKRNWQHALSEEYLIRSRQNRSLLTCTCSSILCSKIYTRDAYIYL